MRKRIRKYLVYFLIGEFLSVQTYSMMQERVEEAVGTYHSFREVVLEVLESPPEDTLFREQEILRERGVDDSVLSRLLEPSRLIDQDHLLEVSNNPKEGEEGHISWNDHPGTAPLRHLIQDLQERSFEGRGEEARRILLQTYQTYHQRLINSSPQERSSLLKHHALLFDPEGTSYGISQELARHIRGIDLYGGSVRQAGQAGIHTVVPLPSRETPQVWFKSPSSIADLDPGMEMATYGFYRLLFQGKWGGGSPPTRLLVLDGVEIKSPQEGTLAMAALNETRAQGLGIEDYKRRYPQYFQQFTPQNAHYILQASQHVRGTPLDQVIARIQDLPTEQERRDAYRGAINPGSYSAMVLSSLLLIPSDYKGDNLILTDQGNIIGIDNDAILGIPLTRFNDTQHYFHLKNILYLLPLMEDPIDQEVKNYFISLSPERVLTAWLSYLLEQTRPYEDLLRRGILREEDTKWLPLKFREEMMRELMERMILLQGKLKFPGITHQALFELFMPGFSHMYKTLLRRSQNNPLVAMETIYNGGSIETLFNLEEERVSRRLSDGRIESLSLKRTLQDEMEELRREQESSPQAQELEGRLSSLEETLISFSQHLTERSSYQKEKLKEAQLEKIRNLITGRNSLSALDESITREFQEIAFMKRKIFPTLEEIALEERHDLITSFLLKRKLVQSFLPKTIAQTYYQHHLLLGRENSLLSQEIVDSLSSFTQGDPEVSYELALNLILPIEEEKDEEIVGEEESLFIFKSTTFEEGGFIEERRVLNPEILEQVLNSDGTFKRVGEYGRRIVTKAQVGPYSLYSKILPELPGIEEQVGYLMRDILKYGAPHTRLFRAEERESILESSSSGLPVLVSLGIEGVPLQEASEEILQNLNPQRFSALILMTMLTMPEDGKRDNYVIRELRAQGVRKEYEIIPIDNDRSFVPSIAKEEIQERGIRNALQVKTVLYCLEDMKKEIDPVIRHHFINHSPGESLIHWLLDMIRLRGEYYSLFPDPVERERLYTSHQSFIGLPFRPRSVREIYRKLMAMQRILDEKPQITHIDLLHEVEPILGERYGWILNQNLPLHQRFDMVDGENFGREGARRITISSTEDILTGLEIENKQEVRELIAKGHIYSPETTLIELLDEIEKEQKDVLGIKEIDSPEILQEVLESEQRKRLTRQNQQSFLEDFLSQLQKPSLQEITRLILRDLGALEDKHIGRLPVLSKVTHLDLSGTQVGTEGVTLILSKVPQVKYLLLENCSRLEKIVSEARVFTRDPPLTLPHLKSLRAGNTPRLSRIRIEAPNLETLNLENTLLLEEDVMIDATRLKRLNLRNSSIKEQTLDKLIEQNPNLKELKVQGARNVTHQETREKYPFLTKKDIEAEDGLSLAQKWQRGEISAREKERTYGELLTTPSRVKLFASHLPPTLTTLDLRYNNLGAEGVRALAERFPPTITSLNLRANWIRAEGVRALAERFPPTLTTLSLWENNLGAEGARALAGHLPPTLTSLNLHNNDLGDEGVRALAERLPPTLTEVNLGWNNLEDEGARALAEGLPPTITSLNLRANYIGDEGARALAKSLPPTLTEVNLGWNEIETEGVRALAEHLPPTLTSLDLGWNKIGDEGVRALAGHLPPTLTELELGWTALGGKEVRALAERLSLTLAPLDFWDNEIGYEGRRLIREAWGNRGNGLTLVPCIFFTIFELQNERSRE